MKGARDYEGATARIDFDRNAGVDGSITFTGKSIGADSYLAFRLA